MLRQLALRHGELFSIEIVKCFSKNVLAGFAAEFVTHNLTGIQAR